MTDFEDLFGPQAGTEPEDERVGAYVPLEAPGLEVIPRPIPAPVAPPELLRPDRGGVVHDAIREAEERLARAATSIVEAALDWPKVANLQAPPQEWVDEMGLQKATERFVVAQSALMSRSRAPYGLELGMRCALGIFKNRAGERDLERPLNVNVIEIQMVEPPKFPEVVETEGE